MRVGIVTIIDNNNYGNRLQNYALYKNVEKYNVEVVNLENCVRTNERERYIIGLIKNMIKPLVTYSPNKYRHNHFEDFNNKIKNKKFIHAYSRNIRCDCMIVGSDQVWNPENRLSDVDLLNFHEIKNKLSYSASFGVSEINIKNKCKIKRLLDEFRYISVREEAGKKLLEDNFAINNVEVLIDPTMLLTTEEWDTVSNKPEMLKTKKYILNYFLGELSKERRKEIDRIANENNCEVINILDKNDPFYVCGPSEFLYLEKHAFLICTDSFHSSVFAILYNKPFIVFDREQQNVGNMSSRLDTLIDKFKLKNRKFDGKITEENLNHDYSEAYKILEVERQKSKDFLERALDIKK